LNTDVILRRTESKCRIRQGDVGSARGVDLGR
jgi:hypothetical protein